MKKTTSKAKLARSITPAVEVNGDRTPAPELIKPIPPQVPAYDELLSFALAYRNGAILVPIFPSQFNGVNFFDKIVTFVVFQSGKFQIELTLVSGQFLMPDICNPNVDSLVTILSGEVSLTRNHAPVSFGDVVGAPMENGVSNLNGQCVRISPKDTFGIATGNTSAALLSFNMRVDGNNWPTAAPSKLT